MKSGIRKGILSDESVLNACLDQQTIPLNKLHLAAITATGKIVRPQKAAYMFNNLPIPQAEKQSLIEDYVLRSQKANPLVIPQREYSTLSLDKGNALVRQVATQTDGTLGTSVSNQVQTAVNSTLYGMVSQHYVPPPMSDDDEVFRGLRQTTLRSTTSDFDRRDTLSPPSRQPSRNTRHSSPLSRERASIMRQRQREEPTRESSGGSADATPVESEAFYRDVFRQGRNVLMNRINRMTPQQQREIGRISQDVTTPENTPLRITDLTTQPNTQYF